jgi:hypothetical protein
MSAEALLEFVTEFPILHDMTTANYRKKGKIWAGNGENSAEEGGRENEFSILLILKGLLAIFYILHSLIL